MQTTISADNPHGHDRYGFAWEHLPAGTRALLDFGCDDGFFLASVARSRAIPTLAGVDAARDAVAEGRRAHPELDLRHLTAGAPLPWSEASFDAATMLDVLEHVYEQRAVLRELWRVLRPGGTLIVTVPGQHAFSFLDRGNVQFYWPALFRWYYLRNHSEAEYDYHYRSNPDGLVGCVSARKRWHEHFSPAYLERLLREAGFSEVRFDGAGFFQRLIDTVDFSLGRPGRRAGWERIKRADARRFRSADLFCTARKGAARP